MNPYSTMFRLAVVLGDEAAAVLPATPVAG